MTHGGWMLLVTDASVVVKSVLTEDDSEAARQLMNGEHELHVPRVLVAELTNALWSKVQSGLLTPSEASQAQELVLALHLEWANDEALAADALRIAIGLNHPGLNHPVYDCVYLALAYQVGGTLVTADTRFFNTVAGTEHAGRVVLLADFAPE